MSPSEHDAVLREAAALKMRAMRLRTLGDAEDRWEAMALFRDAAARELAALAAPVAEVAEDRAGAMIEACGLFLLGRDPLRAAQQWAALPAGAFAGEGGLAKVATLKTLHATTLIAFADAWRSLLGQTGTCPVTELRADQIRALVDAYPGVPELWWGLAVRADSPGEAALARSRAVRLDPTLVDDEAGKAAWDRMIPPLSYELRVELSPERRGARLDLEPCSRALTAFAALLAGFAERTVHSGAALFPASAAAPDPTGMFVVHVAAEGLPPFALESLCHELGAGLTGVDAGAALALLSLLQEHRIRLAVRLVRPQHQPGLLIDAGRRRAMIEAATSAALRTIDSRDVPQADDIERVFRTVESIVRGDPEGKADITSRQASYYRRAGKILGLLTESDQPTPAGRRIARLDRAARLRAGTVHFESSACGDAWIRWSNGTTLRDVAPASAADFLRQSVPGLSRDTAERRAQTLASWYRTLIEQHDLS